MVFHLPWCAAFFICLHMWRRAGGRGFFMWLILRHKSFFTSVFVACMLGVVTATQEAFI